MLNVVNRERASRGVVGNGYGDGDGLPVANASVMDVTVHK
jgi:hypothetical protein